MNDDELTPTPDEARSRLDRIFRRSCLLLGRSSAPSANIVFYPYAGMRHTIRLRDGRIHVRLSDILESAPDAVLGALMTILLCKLWNRRPPDELRRIYRDYVQEDSVRDAWNQVRRRRGRKALTSPQGRCFDLEDIYGRLNADYFDGRVSIDVLSWSRRPNRRVLGHYDEAHRAIVVDRRLDRPSTPLFVVEYVLFHEMLHAALGVTIRNGRRCVHPPHFRQAEKAFPRHEEALRFIRERL